MQSLYPAESNHLVDVESLAAQYVMSSSRASMAARAGALVLSTDGHAEIKRVFVDPTACGEGVVRAIMEALEREAASLGVTLMQLETGIKQPEAIALYCTFGHAERGPGVASFPCSMSNSKKPQLLGRRCRRSDPTSRMRRADRFFLRR